MKWIAGLFVAAALTAGEGATVFYSKHFPGSTPAFVSIELQQDGRAVYREAPDDADPVTFKLSGPEVEQIWALVEKLGHFDRPLESGLKVASMGKKTFRYENGSEKHEVEFNFSVDEDARVLLDLFERITETQQLLFNLERSVRFDKLGVNKALLQVEAAWDRKRLVGPDRFLPMLDRVVKNDSYLNMARERAAMLTDLFRAPRTEAPAPPSAQ